MSEKEILAKAAEAVVKGDDVLAKQVAEEMLAANIDVEKAIHEGFSKGMKQIGDMFECKEVYLPELMLAADAIEAGLAVLLPKLKGKKRATDIMGKVVIGTVAGDIHDIGKNLVSTILAINGFEVFDLGKDVPPQEFIKKAEEVSADIIGLSSLMSTSMYYQKDVIEYLKAKGVRNKYYVVLGGGPITSEWAKKVWADGLGKYPEDAVNICKKLLADRKTPGTQEPLIVGYDVD